MNKRTEQTDSNILIVDDDLANIRFLSMLLKEEGYTVRIALNGQTALDTLTTKLPDLILLDITMPDMSGFEVCQHLKASEQYKEIPVIFLSSLEKTVDKVKGFQVGAIDYITKPFAPEEVLARLKTHLSLRIMQRRLEKQNIQLQEAGEQLERRVQERTRELSKANAALRESEERYTDLYNNAPDMYASVDAKSALVLRCNQTLANKLGYSKSEIIGQPIFALYHQDSMAAVQTTFRGFLETGEIHNAEQQLKPRDGSKIDVNMNVTAVRCATKMAKCSTAVPVGLILLNANKLKKRCGNNRNYWKRYLTAHLIYIS